MSRSTRFVSGIAFGYLYQVLVMVAGIWLTPFLLGMVGQRDYGLWLVGTQLLAYLQLLDIGVAGLLVREAAYATGRAQGSVQNATDLPVVVGKILKIILYQTPMVAIAAGLIWWFMPSSWAGLQGPFGLVIVAFLLLFPARIFQLLLYGIQDTGYIGRISIANWVVSTTLNIVLVWFGWGLYALTAAWITGQLLTAGSCYVRIRQKFPTALPRRLPKLSYQDVTSYLTKGAWASLGQLSQVLVSGSDMLVIGRTLGPAGVVPYSCTGKLISVLANQPQLVMQVAAPGLSELRTNTGQSELVRVAIVLGQGMLLISGALACISVAANKSFVNWWVGGDQYGGFFLTLSIAIVMVLRHWNYTLVNAMFCLGKERRISITTGIDGVITIAASVLLVNQMGPIGAPLGSIVGVSLASLPFNILCLAAEVQGGVSEFTSVLVGWFLRFALVLGVACGLAQSSLSGAVGVLLAGAGIGLLYALATFTVVTRGALAPYVFPQLRKIWLKLLGPSKLHVLEWFFPRQVTQSLAVSAAGGGSK
ncbi:MAG TPA: oligosaccharide flippase family protein [Bryobacteraceae bacterium]|nr:oligosaccharide flippase family protein [Bryobacteraceae bacterium]